MTADELRRLDRVAHNRLSLWVALVMALIGLTAFVILFNLLPDVGEETSRATLMLLGVLISLAPAGLWLGVFYRLDRLEPEPKQLVAGVFVLGALATAALHQPVLQGLFDVDQWLFDHWWAQLLGGILVVGFFEQWLIFLTVRYSVYTHREFDERVDGVIYATAAGLGMATVLNIVYVVERGGVDLDIGSIRIVVNALAYASFAGIQGYFMGQARFETTPVHYLPAGLSLAAVANGLFFFVLAQSGSGALSYWPWRDLILTTVVAVAALSVVFWLVARANEETLRLLRQRGQGSQAPDRTDATGGVD